MSSFSRNDKWINNNLEKYDKGIKPEEFIEVLYQFMEHYYEIIRSTEREMVHIETWAKLIIDLKL